MTQRNGITAGELAILSAATPREEVKQRQGPGGRMLDYIDARFVMDRLDQIGPENWQDRYEDRADGSVRGGIGVLVDGEWVWKWDVGDQSDIESEKGAYSNAFKRAGVKWGIARDLYGHAPHKSPGVTSSAPAAPPKAAGRTSPRPAASTVPPEPEWFAETSAVEVAREARGGTQTAADDGTCPQHGKPWKENSRGFYCATKVGEGWCDERPTQRWVQARGVGAGR